MKLRAPGYPWEMLKLGRFGQVYHSAYLMSFTTAIHVIIMLHNRYTGRTRINHTMFNFHLRFRVQAQDPSIVGTLHLLRFYQVYCST